MFFAIPTFTIIFLAIISTYDKFQKLENTRFIISALGVISEFDELIFGLQKERGLTSGLMNNGSFRESLSQQYIENDKYIESISRKLTFFPEFLSPKTQAKWQDIRALINSLPSIRSKVSTFESGQLFADYTHIILKIVNLIEYTESTIQHRELDNIASSFISLLWVEEHAGLERGALNGIYAFGEIKPEQFRSVLSDIVGQQASLRRFNNIANEKHKAFLADQLSHPSARQVTKYRELLFNWALRDDAINELQIFLGYGGLIHNFKNYVIRGEEVYFDNFIENYAQIIEQIGLYRGLLRLGQTEHAQLDVIQSTVEQYKERLNTVQHLKIIKNPVAKIDKMVTVDDQPVLDAIATLRESQKKTVVDVYEWWKYATERMDGLHRVSQVMSQDMITLAKRAASKDRLFLTAYVCVVLMIIGFCGYLALKIRNRLIGSIENIVNTMRESHLGNVPRNFLKIEGNDEISEMASSFNFLVNERLENYEALRLAASVFRDAHEGIVITDLHSKIVDINPTFCEITGYSREEVIGNTPKLLSSGKQPPDFYKNLWSQLGKEGYWHGEIWNKKKNGEIYPELLTITALKNEREEITHYVGIFSDITEGKRQQEQLEVLAYYDPLTNLPNRTLFADRFKMSLSHCKRDSKLLAICFLDLDDFKPVNDRFGHDIGDLLLISVAQRINSILRESDSASRQGGDEFILLLGDIDNIPQIQKLLDRLIFNISKPYYIEGICLNVSASVGVNVYPHDDADLDTLIRHADQAMYRAKLEGKNSYNFYSLEADKKTIERHHHLQEIKDAIVSNELCLFYQPKINMATGKIYGVEALIRWNKPNVGLVPPLEFLPVVAGSALDIEIGNWVLRSALNQVECWALEGLLLEVSINISSYHLLSSEFVEQLESALADYPKVNPDYLQIEVLESGEINDVHKVEKVMAHCQDSFGISFALDDFGTGYSSLTHLRNLPARTIKIDQSFVRDMLDDTNDYSIIHGVIGLSNSFGRNIIAEGVETTEHGLMLLLMGCNKAQGYGIAKPMPSEDVASWVASFQANSRWIECGARVRTQQETSLELFRLASTYLFRQMTQDFVSVRKELPAWRCKSTVDCHCGAWIKHAKFKKVFNTEWLSTLQAAHERFHELADRMYGMHQSSELTDIKKEIHELERQLEEMQKLTFQVAG